MRDTFWAHEGETLSTGLIDVKSEEAFGAFEVNLGRLYQRCEAFVPGFTNGLWKTKQMFFNVV